MKKRIVAAALAAVLVCGIIGLRPKASGAAAVGAIVTIGVFAWQMIGVMTGQYDAVAKGIGYVIENGVEGFENIGEFLSNDVAGWIVDGWNSIFDQSQAWYESGDITVTDDGKVILTYSQYLELYKLVGSAAVTDTVDFTTDIPYLLIKAQPGILYNIDRAICVNNLEDLYKGCYYSPVLYNADSLYFCSGAVLWKMAKYPGKETYACNGGFSVYNYDLINYKLTGGSVGFGGAVSCVLDNIYEYAKPCIAIATDQIVIAGSSDVMHGKQVSINDLTWYKYDSGTLTVINDIDTVGLSFGLLNCEGDYMNFIKSIASFTSVATPADLDDLSGVLPLDKTKNPTLEVDTDPAITNPADAVTVKDVPGTPDMTLSDYQAQTKLDIDVPSIICTKFPFCIPFDLIRILGVFAADPKAPVFRIPISTSMDNLEGFGGNQTIGEMPENYEPLFELDEELVLDLSVIPLVQPICYTAFIIGFVVLLLHITPKMIQH